MAEAELKRVSRWLDYEGIPHYFTGGQICALFETGGLAKSIAEKINKLFGVQVTVNEKTLFIESKLGGVVEVSSEY